MKLTLDELIEFLRQYGDQDEVVGAELTGDVGEVTFEDLGFDSLGLFNTTTRIEREHGVRLPYDDVVAAQTPGELLELVNERLGAQV